MTTRDHLGRDAWAILRCSNCKTLELAASLTDAGFEAWSPVEEIRKAVRGKYEWLPSPMIPSFVFATVERLQDLLSLSHSPALQFQVWDSEKRRMVVKGHAQFRLFQVDGEIATVPSRELDPLRRIEGRRKRKPRGKAREWSVGDRVRLTEGAYEGLRGVVTAVKGKKIEILVPGSRLSFDVPTWLPIPDLDEPVGVKVSAALPEHRFSDAARAA